MALDSEPVGVEYEVVVADEASGVVRVSVDLCAHALRHKARPLDARATCRIVAVSTCEAVPHRAFYTNDLAYDTEQIAWRAEQGGRYRISRLATSRVRARRGSWGRASP